MVAVSLALDGLVEKPSMCAREAGYGSGRLRPSSWEKWSMQSTQWSLARWETPESVTKFSRMFKGFQTGYPLS